VWGIAIFFIIFFLLGMYLEKNKQKIRTRKANLKRRLPSLLQRPAHWPGMYQYNKSMELCEKMLFWPLKLGVMGNTWIVNLWFASIFLIPLMFPFTIPVLLNALTKHWFWYRIGTRIK
jgi:hypothetical protein